MHRRDFLAGATAATASLGILVSAQAQPAAKRQALNDFVLPRFVGENKFFLQEAAARIFFRYGARMVGPENIIVEYREGRGEPDVVLKHPDQIESQFINKRPIMSLSLGFSTNTPGIRSIGLEHIEVKKPEKQHWLIPETIYTNMKIMEDRRGKSPGTVSVSYHQNIFLPQLDPSLRSKEIDTTVITFKKTGASPFSMKDYMDGAKPELGHYESYRKQGTIIHYDFKGSIARTGADGQFKILKANDEKFSKIKKWMAIHTDLAKTSMISFYDVLRASDIFSRADSTPVIPSEIIHKFKPLVPRWN